MENSAVIPAPDLAPCIIGISPKTRKVELVALNTDDNWAEARLMGLVVVPTSAEVARSSFGEVVADIFTSNAEAPSPIIGDSSISLLIAERLRQINVEGRTAEHDDVYVAGELPRAAAAYALSAASDDWDAALRIWPWSQSWWKPKNRVRDLIRAGALILAEIDRLERLNRSEMSRHD
jgi:hypothetical protein